MSGSIAVCTYTAAQNVISCDVYICCMMMQQYNIAQVKCRLSKHETEIARRFYDHSLGRLATSKSRHCSHSRQQSRVTFIVCVNLYLPVAFKPLPIRAVFMTILKRFASLL